MYQWKRKQNKIYIINKSNEKKKEWTQENVTQKRPHSLLLTLKMAWWTPNMFLIMFFRYIIWTDRFLYDLRLSYSFYHCYDFNKEEKKKRVYTSRNTWLHLNQSLFSLNSSDFLSQLFKINDFSTATTTKITWMWQFIYCTCL